MITLKQLKSKLEKDFGWENLESDDNKWFVDNLLKDTIQAIEVIRCCNTLKTKDRIAFHVFAEINKYTKCFEGYKRDGKTFSETEVLKIYNTYLQSI